MTVVNMITCPYGIATPPEPVVESISVVAMVFEKDPAILLGERIYVLLERFFWLFSILGSLEIPVL